MSLWQRDRPKEIERHGERDTEIDRERERAGVCPGRSQSPDVDYMKCAVSENTTNNCFTRI